MSRVLITGVNGFTGRYLAPRLAEAGYEVHGTVYGTSGVESDGVRHHRVDISDYRALAELIDEVAADKIVHLAAISFVAHGDVAEMYRTNILGTRNLLAALDSTPKPPSAVLLASSANVYGNVRESMLDESAPVAPANDYGITKAALELLARSFAGKLPLIVVRPFNYTGIGQPQRFLIPKILAHARNREPRIELGNLDVARDFSDVRCVADVYARLLATPEAIGGTFNVCSGSATNLRKLIEVIGTLSGRDIAVTVNPEFVRTDEVKVLWGSPAKLERVIGPVRMPPLEETLRWMMTE